MKQVLQLHTSRRFKNVLQLLPIINSTTKITATTSTTSSAVVAATITYLTSNKTNYINNNSNNNNHISNQLPHRNMTDIVDKLRSPVKLSNRENVAGTEIIRELGVVTACAFRSKNIFTDLWMAIAKVFGGEVLQYTHLLSESTMEATKRLLFSAEELGANSVVRVRYQTTATMNRLVLGLHVSVLCYGTAVIDKPVVSKSSPPDS